MLRSSSAVSSDLLQRSTFVYIGRIGAFEAFAKLSSLSIASGSPSGRITRWCEVPEPSPPSV